MRGFRNMAMAGALLAMSLPYAVTLYASDQSGAPARMVAKPEKDRSHRLTSDDRLSLLASALDARVQRAAEPDCSHLVHSIYQAAGFPYDYVPSSDLYAGVTSFRRVKSPLPGDLVVWRGHVGIVIKPSRHIFFSYLSSGPGTDNYEAAYWKHRGQPRFYRYVKTALASHMQ